MNPALDLPSWCKPTPIVLENCGAWLLTGDTWAPVLTALIGAAKVSVDTAQYSLTTRWDETPADAGNVIAALRTAPARGVRCRALLAQHKRSSNAANFNWWAQKHLGEAGWIVRRSPPARLLHAKVFIIDGCAVVTGSHNCTQAASTSNIDLSLWIQGEQPAIPFKNWFNNAWAANG